MSQTKDTKQVILDTALKLFSQKGFKGATMRDISQQANISLGLTYSYFANKETLLEAILTKFISGRRQLFKTLIRQLKQNNTSSINILKNMIYDIKNHKEQFRLYAQLMLSSHTSKKLLSIKKSLKKFHQEEKEFVAKINQNQLKPPIIPAELFKILITGMMFLYIHQDDFDINQSLKLITAIFDKKETL